MTHPTIFRDLATEGSLWLQTFSILLQKGMEVEKACTEADKALDAWRKRNPTIQTGPGRA